MTIMNDNYGFFNHKNIELLRFYIDKNLKQIEEQLKRRNEGIISYIIASLVDLFIVLFFYDELKNVKIITKLFIIVGLVVLLVFISKTINMVQLKRAGYRNILGKESLINPYERQKIIDEFDNIACDGLLVCLAYIDKANNEDEQCKKLFYLYEVIHHFSKSINIFREIYNGCSSYVSPRDDQLLDSFRVKNFIEFSRMINLYLQQDCKTVFPQDKDLDRVLKNISDLVNNWDHFDQTVA